jgi:hypothetical protein
MKIHSAALLALLALAASTLAEVKIEAVRGQSAFKLRYDKATDFSGITWVQGGDFYMVSNREQGLYPLKLEIAATGAITSAKIGSKIPVKSRLDDFEGIAYWPERDRLYVSTERPPGIVGFDRAGDATFNVEVPKVFAKARQNKGLEALARGPGVFWTGNEDALQGDGNPSAAAAGALVRLQKFDDSFRPIAQFAYRTETSLLRAGNSGTGVTDLVVLPDGGLIVLERVVGLGLSAKLFQVDPVGATDTSSLPSFDAAEVVPVKKRVLYERNTGMQNFEGVALGPELAEGWRSLILVADSGGGKEHTFIPLRIKVSASE